VRTINLSDKEKKIIRYICRQYTAKEIGEKMGFTHRTIEDYKRKIQIKLRVRNSVGIALYAVKSGIFPLK